MTTADIERVREAAHRAYLLATRNRVDAALVAGLRELAAREKARGRLFHMTLNAYADEIEFKS